jgi:hypothetical protein
MSSLVEQVGQAEEPISLDLAKKHLKVETSQDDDLIELYLSASRELLEDATNRSFITKTYRQVFDGFPVRAWSAPGQRMDYGHVSYWNRRPNTSQQFKLFKSPLTKVVKISYLSLDTQQWIDLFPVPEAWVALEEYAVGDQIGDRNGNLQEVSAVQKSDDDENPPTSGSTEPASWGTNEGDTTTDGALTWTCKGVAPAGDFLYDRGAEPPRVFPLAGAIWPAAARVANSVSVYFQAGYGSDPNTVPARARVAILQLLGNYYENRETTTAADLKEIPSQYKNLVWSLKVQDLAPTDA